MAPRQQTDLNFPLATFLAQRAAIQTERQTLARERASWKSTRDALGDATDALDEQFRDTFEALQEILYKPYSPELKDAVDALQTLVNQGASAHLLGNYELGTFNLAMAIQEAEYIQDASAAALFVRLVRLTVIADADLHAQKAYAGNGGSISLEWLCLYLSGSPFLSEKPSELALECYYTIFPVILEATLAKPKTPDTLGVDPSDMLIHFLVTIRASAVPRAWQQNILLRFMACGLSPVLPDNIYMYPDYFRRIASFDIQWYSILFPQEQEPLRAYINRVKSNLTSAIVRDLINSFTSTVENRKYFKSWFAQPHWLLTAVADIAPEIIFSLVKRNEQDLLKPFLKYLRPTLLGLRDADGNTLLHVAASAPGLMKNMVTLLLQNNFLLAVVNKRQLTPYELAVKYKRTVLLPLLRE